MKAQDGSTQRESGIIFLSRSWAHERICKVVIYRDKVLIVCIKNLTFKDNYEIYILYI